MVEWTGLPFDNPDILVYGVGMAFLMVSLHDMCAAMRAGMVRASRVVGLNPLRAGRRRADMVPKPAIRMVFPCTSSSLMTLAMALTAASACFWSSPDCWLILT
ncbi:MAG: hypothetical protein OXH65_05210 [Paracoccaceae bacterium]|nr:hypothetical protein [Paracoccaceae bacterium]